MLFDAHLHIIDPAFLLQENNGFLPDPFTVADYQERVRGFDVRGGAVVSGSFLGFDQTYLTAAMRRLGPGFVGVTQLPADTPDEEIRELADAGVRAVRFNLKRGGSAGLEDLDHFARRVFEVAGWHTELYIDTRTVAADAALRRTIATLPAVSIDHLGMHADGLPQLCELVEAGVHVKATGFGRVELDPARAMAEILRVNPGALMVGTDVPSTRAKRPFRESDLDLIRQTVGEAVGDSAVEDVFYNNAARWYRVAD